jgi:hypothetical protein
MAAPPAGGVGPNQVSAPTSRRLTLAELLEWTAGGRCPHSRSVVVKPKPVLVSSAVFLRRAWFQGQQLPGHPRRSEDSRGIAISSGPGSVPQESLSERGWQGCLG